MALDLLDQDHALHSISGVHVEPTIDLNTFAGLSLPVLCCNAVAEKDTVWHTLTSTLV
jgi:hypothetical protein